MELDWTTGKLAEGLRLYHAGEFFAAHEKWESVWLEADGAEKTLLQGVIQVTAALHHYYRGNWHGTMLLLHAALRRLEPCQDSFGGLAVGELCADVRDWLRVLENGDSERQLAPPRIRPCAEPST